MIWNFKTGKNILDFSEQKVDTSRFKLKRHFSTFLDFLEEKSNLGLKTELELKLPTTALGSIHIQLMFVFT